MGSPLIDLLIAIVALCGLIGVVGLVRSGLYDHIGESDGPLPTPRPEPHPGSPAAAAERDLEIRQMLRARNERRVRQGDSPADIDAEVTRLMSHPDPATGADFNADRDRESKRHDPELVEELRQLAEARNRRRMRRGEQPLDVRAEVERALAELDG